MTNQPLRLLQEVVEDTEIITEAKSGDGNSYIKGVFLMGEQVNKNGRIYPMSTLVPAVKLFNEEFVLKNRAVGELNHPASPTVNLDRIAVKIVEMTESGNDYVGKARILKEQPMGKILANLIEEGIQIGVSSRGTGTVQRKGGKDIVEGNYRIAAVDAVHDPSAYKALVDSVMENVGWVYDLASNSWQAQKIIEAVKEEGDKSSVLLEQNALKWFTLFSESLINDKPTPPKKVSMETLLRGPRRQEILEAHNQIKKHPAGSPEAKAAFQRLLDIQTDSDVKD